jgi:hypothetical protein
MALVLFIIFLVLKLEKIIDWSWKWITAPLWVPFVCGLLFTLLFVIIYGAIVLLGLFIGGIL